MIKPYIYVAKPGIVLSNLLTGFTAFYLASNGHFEVSLMLWAMLGLTLMLASSTTLNNYIDRDLDVLMQRTHNRVSVKGGITGKAIFIFGAILGIAGLLILYFFVNTLTAVITLIGFIIYVVIYSIYFKRISSTSTLIGSISGAIPPLAGYTAFSNVIDTKGLIFFLILVFWQMPHFYAIGIYRLQDYVNARIPILPVKYGVKTTKIHMLWWTSGFLIVSTLPFYAYNYVGLGYTIAASVLGLGWLALAIVGFFAQNAQKWARGFFIYSVVHLTLLCILIMLKV